MTALSSIQECECSPFQRANHTILYPIICYRKALSPKCQFSCECRSINKKQFVVFMKYFHAVYFVACASAVVAE